MAGHGTESKMGRSTDLESFFTSFVKAGHTIKSKAGWPFLHIPWSLSVPRPVTASHESLTNSRKNDLHQTPFEKKNCLKGIPSKEASHKQSPVKMKKNGHHPSFLVARRFRCLWHTISTLSLLQDSKCVARKACSVPVCMVSTDSPTAFSSPDNEQQKHHHHMPMLQELLRTKKEFSSFKSSAKWNCLPEICHTSKHIWVRKLQSQCNNR